MLDAGGGRELTPEEMARHNNGRARARAILFPGSKNKKLIVGLDTGYCIDLEARYWARRAQAGEKEILELRKNWGLAPGAKKKLIAKMDERLGGENPDLTAAERYNLDACMEKLK